MCVRSWAPRGEWLLAATLSLAACRWRARRERQQRHCAPAANPGASGAAATGSAAGPATDAAQAGDDADFGSRASCVKIEKTHLEYGCLVARVSFHVQSIFAEQEAGCSGPLFSRLAHSSWLLLAWSTGVSFTPAVDRCSLAVLTRSCPRQWPLVAI